jgi:predicted RNA-binding Zn ribbon-like protein
MGDVRRMELVGGHVAVDFINTLGGLPERPDDEYLFGYLDVLAWLEHVGLLSPEGGHELADTAGIDPRAAAEVFDQIRRLRVSLDRVLRCRLTDEAPDPQDLDIVRAAYAGAAVHATLLAEVGSYRLSWDKTDNAMGWPLWVLADSAVALLTAAPLHLLGRCQHCRWLFLDYSKNHSRRWCSMNSCGAIAKMRRYRAARRDNPESSDQ